MDKVEIWFNAAQCRYSKSHQIREGTRRNVTSADTPLYTWGANIQWTRGYQYTKQLAVTKAGKMSPAQSFVSKNQLDEENELLRNINPFKSEFTSSSSNTSCRNSRLVGIKSGWQSKKMGDKVKKDSVIIKQFHEDFRSKPSVLGN